MDADNDTPLPLPRFSRKKNKFGQEEGPFTVKVGKKRVNLKTENYIVARERAREAFYDGKTVWGEAFYDKSPKPETNGVAPEKPIADWAADLASAASTIRPDEYRRPNGETLPLLSSIPHTEDEPPRETKTSTPDADSTKIPPDMFANMMETAATILVEGQLRGQEWVIEKYAKRKAAPVPMSDTSRAAAVEFWKQQLAEWIPTDVPLPKWASAIVVVGTFGLMTQLQNSEPLPPKDAPPV